MPKNSSVLKRPLVPEDASKMSEAQLLSTLKSLGIEVTRPKLEKIFDRTLSMHHLVEFIVRRYCESGQESVDLDFITESLFELSHRWFSAKVSFDRLHDKMDESYDVDIESKKGLNSWLAVWKEVLQLQNVTDIRTAREFDDHYPGMYSLQNWFDCFDNKLRHAGISDPQFYRVRISVSEEAIKRLGLRSASELDRWTERRRISMAASYFKLGETEKTDELYKKWLSANPTWGKGWGAWALNYSTDKPEQFDKAEQILKEGLAVKAVKGRNDLIDGLAGLYIKQDRLQDVSCMYEQLAYDDSDPDFEDEEYDDDDRALKEFWSDEALLSAMSELILTPK